MKTLSSKNLQQKETNAREPMLKDAVRDYAKAKAELFGIEAKEASQILGKRAVKVIIALALGFFAWMCFIIALILLGEKLTSHFPQSLQIIGGGVIVAFILVLIHVIATISLLSSVRKKLEQPLFQYTKSELEKDREWLEKKTQ